MVDWAASRSIWVAPWTGVQGTLVIPPVHWTQLDPTPPRQADGTPNLTSKDALDAIRWTAGNRLIIARSQVRGLPAPPGAATDAGGCLGRSLRPQPQPGLGRLDRLVGHGQELDGQGVQVDLVTQAAPKAAMVRAAS